MSARAGCAQLAERAERRPIANRRGADESRRRWGHGSSGAKAPADASLGSLLRPDTLGGDCHGLRPTDRQLKFAIFV
jgi:hypothetical protein